MKNQFFNSLLAGAFPNLGAPAPRPGLAAAAPSLGFLSGPKGDMILSSQESLAPRRYLMIGKMHRRNKPESDKPDSHHD
jgi:hypothetical protein